MLSSLNGSESFQIAFLPSVIFSQSRSEPEGSGFKGQDSWGQLAGVEQKESAPRSVEQAQRASRSEGSIPLVKRALRREAPWDQWKAMRLLLVLGLPRERYASCIVVRVRATWRRNGCWLKISNSKIGVRRGGGGLGMNGRSIPRKRAC